MMAPRAARAASSGAAAGTAPDVAAIIDDLRGSAGLVFPENRRLSAEAGIRRAMEHLGIRDLHAFRVAVHAPGEARDALLAELTVGETYFFRESPQLDFLRREVLPTLRDRGPAHPLRMWSAACASGEEPYTLAIMLHEAAWPHRASILGTDITAARLAAAERARYTQWSMRGVSPTIVGRYFEQRGRHFLLRNDLRSAVDFGLLNLVDDGYPAPASRTMGLDIVLCRNVLIYFDEETVQAIGRRLLASLAPDGWLFLGASDPSLIDLVECEVVVTGAGLAYRRANAATKARRAVQPSHRSTLPPPPPTATAARSAEIRSGGRVTGDMPFVAARPFALPAGVPAPVGVAGADAGRSASTRAAPPLVDVKAPVAAGTDAADAPRAAYAVGDYATAARDARAALARRDDAGTWVVLVRALANLGRLADAGEASAAALDRHALSAELNYLHATLLAQAGRHGDAAAAARRALYLDRELVIAHLALGDALARTGNGAAAGHAFAAAVALLAALPPVAIVPATDGESAARLLQIARYRLNTLTAGSFA